MKRQGGRMLAAGAAALCLAGCASTVTIQRPVDRTSVVQITDFFEVSIDTATETNFNPTVDGSVPPPPRDFKVKSTGNGRTIYEASNGRHDFGPGIHRLRVTAPASPSRMFVPYAATADFIQAQFTVSEHVVVGGAISSGGPAGTSGPGSAATPAAGFFVGAGRSKTIGIFSPVTSVRPIELEIVPSANVSLAAIAPAPPLLPALPLKVSIPPGERGMLLTLTGLSPGPFSISVAADGFRPSGLQGTVAP